MTIKTSPNNSFLTGPDADVYDAPPPGMEFRWDDPEFHPTLEQLNWLSDQALKGVKARAEAAQQQQSKKEKAETSAAHIR